MKPDGGLAVAKPTPYEKARTEIDKGNVARAVELLEDAIKKAPPGDLPRLRTLYSDALRRQAGLLSDRSGPKAERLLTKAVAADPKNGKAYFDLGKIRMKAKEYPGAIRAFREAATLGFRPADTLYNLGFVYASTGDFGNAEKMFHRVASLKPSYLDKALFNLAAVQQKQGKRQECIHSLKKALAVNPNNQRAQTYLRRIEAAP